MSARTREEALRDLRGIVRGLLAGAAFSVMVTIPVCLGIGNAQRARAEAQAQQPARQSAEYAYTLRCMTEWTIAEIVIGKGYTDLTCTLLGPAQP